MPRDRTLCPGCFGKHSGIGAPCKVCALQTAPGVFESPGVVCPRCRGGRYRSNGPGTCMPCLECCDSPDGTRAVRNLQREADTIVLYRERGPFWRNRAEAQAPAPVIGLSPNVPRPAVDYYTKGGKAVLVDGEIVDLAEYRKGQE